jgi:hypothetical protein
MHIALQGALIGLLVAVVMFLTDYMLIKKAVAERAKRRGRAPEMEGTERERLKTLFRYVIFLPVGGAFLFWLIWG